jgi:hypothetical protein
MRRRVPPVPPSLITRDVLNRGVTMFTLSLMSASFLGRLISAGVNP